LVRRTPAALAQARRNLWDQIDQIRFAQFLLFRQGEHLKAHARAKGLRLIGDLPFFVSADSSDVWANPELFLLDEQHRPRFVAGVPPDYFSVQGQLWGNPVYDWDAIRRTGYRWCVDRLRALLDHVDMIRLDHFRGFAAAWHVPIGAATAETGKWVPGPGADFFCAAEKELGALPFIAEDLGLITPDVCALRESDCQECGCSNSRSTANRITPTCLTTMHPILSCTPGPTTIPRLAAGSKNCRVSKDNTCGII
jgi:4-alpha-glucanotransferase